MCLLCLYNQNGPVMLLTRMFPLHQWNGSEFLNTAV
jgi:hypothetical protein